MTCYLLDTNTVSQIIRNSNAKLREKLRSIQPAQLSVSAITEAELRYGLAKKPDASRLKLLVHEFLLRVDIAPWDSEAAACYALLRAHSEAKGISLGTHDMFIAAHAQAIGAILVTNDQAMLKLKSWMDVEDWMR